MPKTEITVQLSGEDGNIFAIVGRVRRALRDNGEYELLEEMSEAVLNCDTYDKALAKVQEYVHVQ